MGVDMRLSELIKEYAHKGRMDLHYRPTNNRYHLHTGSVGKVKQVKLTNKTLKTWEEESDWNNSQKPSERHNWFETMSIYKSISGHWVLAHLHGVDLEPDEIPSSAITEVYSDYQKVLRAAISNTYGYRGISSYLGETYLRMKELAR
jgi:hypothetical protein